MDGPLSCLACDGVFSTVFAAKADDLTSDCASLTSFLALNEGGRFNLGVFKFKKDQKNIENIYIDLYEPLLPGFLH